MRHNENGCRGTIALIHTDYIQLVSLGMKITSNGIEPGVSELQKISERRRPGFMCLKCGKRFETKEDMCNIVEMCALDEKFVPVSELCFTDMGIFCIDCFNFLTSDDVRYDEEEQIKQVIALPKGSKELRLIDIMLK